FRDPPFRALLLDTDASPRLHVVTRPCRVRLPFRSVRPEARRPQPDRHPTRERPSPLAMGSPVPTGPPHLPPADDPASAGGRYSFMSSLASIRLTCQPIVLRGSGTGTSLRTRWSPCSSSFNSPAAGIPRER